LEKLTKFQKIMTKTITGWCAANYTTTDIYNADCGPIRETTTEAMADQKAGDFGGVRYVHTDGHLYVEDQSEGAA
jgi:hypothetical protein